jgi:hypothetical protein
VFGGESARAFWIAICNRNQSGTGCLFDRGDVIPCNVTNSDDAKVKWFHLTSRI